MTDKPEDDRISLAGELALRVLSEADETQARLEARNDAAFAAEVDAWNARLAVLSSEIRPVEPSADLWHRIQAAIAGVANDNGRVTFWRRWAIGSTGLMVASLAAMAVVMAQPPQVVKIQAPAPVGGVTRVATLALESGAPVVTLAYDTATGKLFISPTTQLAGEAGVPHLWLVKPEGGVQLVGIIDGDKAATQSLNAALSGVASHATALAISIEAPGHTPAADKPDGPVVASGELQRL